MTDDAIDSTLREELKACAKASESARTAYQKLLALQAQTPMGSTRDKQAPLQAITVALSDIHRALKDHVAHFCRVAQHVLSRVDARRGHPSTPRQTKEEEY
jgi:hypothetical protein